MIAGWLLVLVLLGLIPVLLAAAILRTVRREIPPSYTSAQVRAALEASGFSEGQADVVIAVLETPRRLRP